MIHVRRAKVHRSVGLTEASSEAGKFAWYLLVDIPASPTEARKLVRYPANFPGLGEALIFFCCFSSIKGRKAGRETPRNSGLRVRFQEETPQNSRLQAYRIQATSPFCTGRHTFPSERHRKKAPHQPYTTDKKPLLSTLYPLRPLLTDPYSRTTAEAAPQPTPRSNTPSVRRGRYGWIARSDAPPPRSPADSRRTD